MSDLHVILSRVTVTCPCGNQFQRIRCCGKPQIWCSKKCPSLRADRSGRSREWYQANRAYACAREHRRRMNHPDKIRLTELRKRGMNQTLYEELLTKQDRRCAICRTLNRARDAHTSISITTMLPAHSVAFCVSDAIARSACSVIAPCCWNPPRATSASSPNCRSSRCAKGRNSAQNVPGLRPNHAVVVVPAPAGFGSCHASANRSLVPSLRCRL